MMISIDSVSVTVAIASGPSFDTQKMSATANTDSITISRTIGTARSRIARPSGSEVKSWRAPRSDSRMSDQNPSRVGSVTSGVAVAAVSGGLMRVPPYLDDERPATGSTRVAKKFAALTLTLSRKRERGSDRALFFRGLTRGLAPFARRVVVGVGRLL